SYLFFRCDRRDVHLDAHPFQARMPAFTHDAKIRERIIEFALDDGFDMVNLHPSLPRQSLYAVHHIGPNGSQDIFQRGDGVVRGIELHRRANAKLMRACKHRRAVLTGCTDAQRPGVALHMPSHYNNGKPVSTRPMKSARWSTVGAMTQPARASRNRRSIPRWRENAAPPQAFIAKSVTCTAV